tara:strand:+ start:582 stop:818 length:237 start_codon:yes stop_codon:yes gene_type:complete
MKELDFAYEYVTDEDKKKVVELQLRELETAHFSMSIVEPSKLNQPKEHLQWRQQSTAIENSIKKLRMFKLQMNQGEEE